MCLASANQRTHLVSFYLNSHFATHTEHQRLCRTLEQLRRFVLTVKCTLFICTSFQCYTTCSVCAMQIYEMVPNVLNSPVCVRQLTMLCLLLSSYNVECDEIIAYDDPGKTGGTVIGGNCSDCLKKMTKILRIFVAQPRFKLSASRIQVRRVTGTPLSQTKLNKHNHL